MLSILASTLLLLPVLQETPAPRPAAAETLLQRARIAEELGDFASAETLLRSATADPDPGLVAAATKQLAALLVRLGRTQDPADRNAGARGRVAAAPKDDDAALSPLERRVQSAIGRIRAEDGQKELQWIGEAALPYLQKRIVGSALAPDIRDLLVESAAKIGGAGALSILEALQASDDDLLRRRALEVFRRHADRLPAAERAPLFVRFLGDRDAGVRAQAIQALQGDPDALAPRLEGLAGDPRSEVRFAIVRSAADVSASVAAMLERDTSPDVRSAIADRIRSGQSWPDGPGTIVRLLGDGNRDVKLNALNALERISIPAEAVDLLDQNFRRLATDPDPWVRRRACTLLNVLVSTGGSRLASLYFPILLALCEDGDASVRESALSTLQQYRNTPFPPELTATAMALVAKAIRTEGLEVRSPQSSAVSLLRFFVERVVPATGRDQLGEMVRLLEQAPEIAPNFGSTLLRHAKAEDAGLLLDLWARSSDDGVRTVVAEVLARLGSAIPAQRVEEIARELRKALVPESPAQLRTNALRAATGLGIALTDAQIEAGFGPLRERDWTQIVDDATALAERSPDAALGILRFVLRADSNRSGDALEAYRHAVMALPGVRRPEALALLCDTALWSRDTTSGLLKATNSEAADGLRLYPPAEVVAVLRERAGAASVGQKKSLAIALAKVGGPEAIRLASEVLLTDADELVRWQATLSLIELNALDGGTAARVVAASQDSAQGMRLATIQYLRKWNVPEAAPHVRRFLDDPDPFVREAAVSALGSLLSQDAVPDLVARLRDGNKEVQDAAKEALERIRFYVEEKQRWDDWRAGRGLDPGAGIRSLLEAVDDAKSDVALVAIESLGTMKAKEALPRLVELLRGDLSAEKRAAIQRAIARINAE